MEVITSGGIPEARMDSYDPDFYNPDLVGNITYESEMNGGGGSMANMTIHELNEMRQHIDGISSGVFTTERIVWAIAYSVIIFLSAVGNSLVVRVCLRSMTRTNLLILCLAASDLTMTAMNIPFNYFRLLHYSWPFGAAMCFTVNFVQYLVVYVSSYTMAIIAIQRYRSVCSLQFEPSSSSGKRRCCGGSQNGRSSASKGGESGGGGSDNDHRADKDEERGGDDDGYECQLSPAKLADRFGRCCGTLGHLCAVLGGAFKKIFVWTSGGGGGGGGHHHSSLPRGPHQLHSLRPIYLCIGTTWLVSALVAALFNYSSVMVEKRDFFGDILILANQQQQSAQLGNGNGSAVVAKTEASSGSNQPNSTVLEEIDFEAEIAKHVKYRCQNPMPASVVDFLWRHSVRAELAKSVVIFLTQYFIPLAISCVLYIRIGKIIKVQGRLAGIRGNPKARIRQRRKRRRILMLVLVVCAFAISWLPLHVFHILSDAGIISYNYQIFMVVHWLAMSSVSYNPWIYCSLNKNFRKAAFRVFCCCCLEEDDELSSSKGGGGGGGSHHDHFSNEGGRPGSSRLLSKVPCCTKKLSGKKDDESRLTNQQMKEQQQRGDGDGGENGALINSKTGQRLPTGALRSGSGGNLDPSCFGNMSCVTETSMVAFNSAGSIERLNHDDDEDVVVPLSAPASVAVATTSAAAATVISKKKHKFNFFRKQNRLGSSSSRGRAAELCQIKIEECSDKMTADSREGHSSSEMLRRSLNQNAEKTKKDNGGGGDLKHQFSDSIDSEEDESDECLLNEGRSPGSRSPRASIEMQSMQQLKQKQQKQQQQRNAPESSVHLLMDCGATPEKGGSDGKTEKEVKFACGDGDEDGSKSNGGVVDGGASLALLTTDL